MARILIADDDSTIRRLARFSCEKLGHEVVEADDATSAIEAYQREPVDLVMLDLKMPGGGGDAFFDMLRVAPRSCRVIVITGATRGIALDTIDPAQVDHVLLKPFRIADVVAAVEKVLTPEAGTGASPGST